MRPQTGLGIKLTFGKTPKAIMIDLALVKERVEATPFRPFKLETTGGKQIQIVTPDHLLFAPESRDLIIAFEPGGHMHLLSTDQLASLEVELPDDRAT